jgi:hypothetical protein
MSPLDRLAWLALVAADQTITVGALRVAVALTQWIGKHTGSCFPSVASIGAAVGMKERGTRQVIRQLEAGGWLAVKRTAGRTSNVYMLATPTRHGGTGLTGHGDAGSNAANPASDGSQPGTEAPPTRHSACRLTGEQGDQGRDALVAVLIDKRALRRRQGRDITVEWINLGLTPERLAELLQRLAPKDRWPSKVRALAEAEAEGLVLTERKASADEIRVALGLTSGEPTNG